MRKTARYVCRGSIHGMTKLQSSQPCQNPAYRKAFDRLDAALEKNSESLLHERIDAIRLRLFGVIAGKTPQNNTLALPE